MTRKPKDKPGNKTKLFNLRVTPQELAQIHENATSEGKTASDYVRDAALTAKGA